MRGKVWFVLAILVAALAIGVSLVGQGLAQGSGPSAPDTAFVEDVGVTTIAPGAIAIQGRVTDAAGNPLDGVYDLTFRLYQVASGGTAICADTNSVTVAAGLFNTYMDYCYDDLWGQKVWLAVEVGSDGEMSPRQVVYPVPYAISLVPGAEISGTLSGAVLTVLNSHASGTGLSVTGSNYGVTALSGDADGYGGYFWNSGGGIGLAGLSWGGNAIYAGSVGGAGVWASSVGGASLAAAGDGVITSTAKSYLWISGNDLRPYQHDDTTVIDADNVGGAEISPGAVVGPKNVMLPIQVTGPLYGQDVTVSGLDIYWSGATTFDGISAVLMRRQTGVCSSASCYETILYDPTDQLCEVSSHPTGCTLHWNLSNNNVLTDDSGILYLTIEVNFGGSSGWVRIGGVRLTLEHD